MSGHKNNFYTLKEVERCLEASKELQDGEEIYYFIGALRYIYDENKQLKYQLQQKEKILKEVRKYVDKNGLFSVDTYNFCNGMLKILDKENK